MIKLRPHTTTKEQAKDTGMALVLILLLISLMQQDSFYTKVATVVLVLDMTFPTLFKPAAIVWLGLSNLLGLVIPRLLLSLVFIFVVTPMGLLRRLAKRDSLQLRSFKQGRDSVMTERNHTYKASDLEKPY